MAVKRLMKCAECGSQDVVRDAWARWNEDTDEWELSQVFDEAFCESCEQSCHIEEVEEPINTAPAEIMGTIVLVNEQYPEGWDSVEGGVAPECNENWTGIHGDKS